MSKATGASVVKLYAINIIIYYSNLLGYEACQVQSTYFIYLFLY